jgi:hypothetical protein
MRKPPMKAFATSAPLASAARVLLAAGFAACAGAAFAASFSELSARGQGGYPSSGYGGPYAASPSFSECPPQCGPMRSGSISGGPEGAPPMPLDIPGAATLPPMITNPTPWLPLSPNGAQPHGQVQLWTFGQVNSTTDPFNPWGLSTPFMFVPWSTPLSGWTNAQTWNWWRERSGALPRNW